MATTVSPPTWKAPSQSHSHSHSHSTSRSSRPMTTPRASHATAASSTPGNSQLSPRTRSPQARKEAKGTSPSYFGFVVGNDSIPGDSGPGPHARQNWNESRSSSSKPTNNEKSPEFDLFRRQSEKNIAFALNILPQTRMNSFELDSQHTPAQSSPSSAATSSQNLSIQGKTAKEGDRVRTESAENPFFQGVQRQESPLSLSPRHSVADVRHSRLSLPAHEIQASLETLKAQRSDTLPQHTSKETHAMVAPQEVAQIIEQYSERTLILDLRVYPHYAASRVCGALNLCIPTTLLKRPAFTVQKLADTFTTDEDKARFDKWRTARYIVVYDATSSLAKEAVTSFNVLKKFVTEGWKGHGLVVKGGFSGFAKLVPRLVEQSNKSSSGGGTPSLPMSPPNQHKLPVAGGCQMPSTKSAANPFFGNIRQNMDLLDGVGQLPIKRPSGMTAAEEKELPSWLRRAASVSNEGKDVSNKFLRIEKTEQQRMQKALSGTVSYGTPGVEKTKEVQVAGIEKGSKNRYNNIFPFEHSRVRLQDLPSDACDYVNASFVKASYSQRTYIATQAPIPQTFNDFWKMTWEQDVRVIVMLTAESEGGQVKSHPYWKSGDYGNLKVRQLAEKKVSLTSKDIQPKEPASKKSSTGGRLTTPSAAPAVEKGFNFEVPHTKAGAQNPDAEPAVIIRHFTISQPSNPFQPMKEVTQLHYTQWPDFGAPASPFAILSLIELVNKFQRNMSSPSTTHSASEPAPKGQRPIIVHCSAGCGRTGTFCTIDSVIDMIKRQHHSHCQGQSKDAMDIDSEDDWVERDDIDLVCKAVEDFRHQRLSMVQNLRQYVLCYESILQWLHDETA